MKIPDQVDITQDVFSYLASQRRKHIDKQKEHKKYMPPVGVSFFQTLSWLAENKAQVLRVFPNQVPFIIMTLKLYKAWGIPKEDIKSSQLPTMTYKDRELLVTAKP